MFFLRDVLFTGCSFYGMFFLRDCYYNNKEEAFMYSTYRLKAGELSDNFVKAVKSAYQDREIEIIIQDVQDETEYLLSSTANAEHLVKAVDEINHRENLVYINLQDL
jgi:antitoxin YefM